jgi:mono/diheme cytochrome c family protein
VHSGAENLNISVRKSEFKKMKIAAWLVIVFAAALTAEQTTSSVWDGVYLPEQAEKGKALYTNQCGMCHGDALEGKNAPALAGAGFKDAWNGLTSDDMFEYIKTSMPRGQVERLSREQTAAIVSYLLQANGFPSGKKEFPSEVKALQSISFAASKPGVESAKSK